MLTIAQIAVGLAGFSAIIVTLNESPIRQWDKTDRLNLRLLIQASIITIGFSLLPSLLNISLAADQFWFYGLLFYGLAHLSDVGFFLLNMAKNTPLFFRNTALCGLVVAIIQILIPWHSSQVAQETMYPFTLIWHLGV